MERSQTFLAQPRTAFPRQCHLVVHKVGETKGTRYHLLGANEEAPRQTRYDRTLQLAGLAEDTVFGEIGIVLNLASKVQDNGFEHSGSDTCRVEATLSDYAVGFSVRDFGVGVFARIRERFALRDEYDG